MAANNKIDEILNLAPILQVESEINDRFDVNDFITGRETLLSLLETGKDALLDIVTIAKQSQHPRAYEVLNAMLKTLADLSGDLVELQIKKVKHVEAVPTDQVVNNNLFVGTTADLQDMIKGMLTNGAAQKE